MSRGSWNKIKQSHLFFVHTCRWIQSALFFSVILSVLLCMGIYHVYFGRHEPDFYATSGITEPVLLQSMDEPNTSAYPLLANDLNTDEESRSTVQ